MTIRELWATWAAKDPAAIENDSEEWIAAVAALKKIEKHLPGQHDQQTHGNWANHLSAGTRYSDPGDIDIPYRSNASAAEVLSAFKSARHLQKLKPSAVSDMGHFHFTIPAAFDSNIEVHLGPNPVEAIQALDILCSSPRGVALLTAYRDGWINFYVSESSKYSVPGILGFYQDASDRLYVQPRGFKTAYQDPSTGNLTYSFTDNIRSPADMASTLAHELGHALDRVGGRKDNENLGDPWIEDLKEYDKHIFEIRRSTPMREVYKAFSQSAKGFYKILTPVQEDEWWYPISQVRKGNGNAMVAEFIGDATRIYYHAPARLKGFIRTINTNLKRNAPWNAKPEDIYQIPEDWLLREVEAALSRAGAKVPLTKDYQGVSLGLMSKQKDGMIAAFFRAHPELDYPEGVGPDEMRRIIEEYEKEYGTEATEVSKHLPGQHDQSTHGNWARGMGLGAPIVHPGTGHAIEVGEPATTPNRSHTPNLDRFVELTRQRQKAWDERPREPKPGQYFHTHEDGSIEAYSHMRSAAADKISDKYCVLCGGKVWYRESTMGGLALGWTHFENEIPRSPNASNYSDLSDSRIDGMQNRLVKFGHMENNYETSRLVSAWTQTHDALLNRDPDLYIRVMDEKVQDTLRAEFQKDDKAYNDAMGKIGEMRTELSDLAEPAMHEAIEKGARVRSEILALKPEAGWVDTKTFTATNEDIDLFLETPTGKKLHEAQEAASDAFTNFRRDRVDARERFNRMTTREEKTAGGWTRHISRHFIVPVPAQFVTPAGNLSTKATDLTQLFEDMQSQGKVIWGDTEMAVLPEGEVFGRRLRFRGDPPPKKGETYWASSGEFDRLRGLENKRLYAQERKLRAVFDEANAAWKLGLQEFAAPSGMTYREAAMQVLSKHRKLGGDIKTRTSRGTALEMLPKAATYFPSDWIEYSNKKNLEFEVRRARGHYRQEGVIRMDKNNWDTLLHEFGHRFEDVVPGISALESQFYTYRTGDQKPVRLTKLLPGYRYGRDEVSRPDKFGHPYMGKSYPNGHFELLSMGLPRLWGYGSDEMDDEMANFLLGVLTTV